MAFMFLFLFFVFLQASRESVRAMLFLVQQLNALCQVRCRAVLYAPICVASSCCSRSSSALATSETPPSAMLVADQASCLKRTSALGTSPCRIAVAAGAKRAFVRTHAHRDKACRRSAFGHVFGSQHTTAKTDKTLRNCDKPEALKCCCCPLAHRPAYVS